MRLAGAKSGHETLELAAELGADGVELEGTATRVGAGWRQCGAAIVPCPKFSAGSGRTLVLTVGCDDDLNFCPMLLPSWAEAHHSRCSTSSAL